MKSISIFGAQSSGKSTLINDLYDLKLDTLKSDQTHQRTTQGIILAQSEQNDQQICILDCEGTDSAERHLNKEISIEEKVGVFTCILSDLIIFNLWFTDLRRFQASNYNVIQQIFKIYQKSILKQRKQLGDRCSMLFVIRDSVIASEKQKTDIIQQLKEDIFKLYNEVSAEKFSDFFDIDVMFISNRIYQFDQYKDDVTELRHTIAKVQCNSMQPQIYAQYLHTIWEAIQQRKDLDLNFSRSEIIKEKCLQIQEDIIDQFAQKLSKLQIEVKQLKEVNQNLMNQSVSFRNLQQSFPLFVFVEKMISQNPNGQIHDMYEEAIQKFDEETAQFNSEESKQGLQKLLQDEIQRFLDDSLKFVVELFTESYQHQMRIFEKLVAQYELENEFFPQLNEFSIRGNTINLIANKLFAASSSKLDLMFSTQISKSDVIENKLNNLLQSDLIMNPVLVNYNKQSIVQTFCQMQEATFVSLLKLLDTFYCTKFLSEYQFHPVVENFILNTESETNFQLTQFYQTLQRNYLSKQESSLKSQLESQNIFSLNLAELRDQFVLANQFEEQISNLMQFRVSDSQFVGGKVSNIQAIQSSLISSQNTQTQLLQSSATIIQQQLSPVFFGLQDPPQDQIRQKLDQIFIKTADSFISKISFKNIKPQLELQFQSLMTQKLSQLTKNEFLTEQHRAESANEVVQQLKHKLQNVGGSVLSQQLTNISLGQIQNVDAIISEFSQKIDLGGYKVVQKMSVQMIVLFSVLLRREIFALFKTKLRMFMMVTLFSVLFFVHEKKDLNVFFAVTKQLFQEIAKFFEDFNWEELQKAFQHYFKQLQKWIK
uniref:Protein SEY1 n=1 Tax=Trepomonas sp. PC1 TaxID=1076344 RepID=A0A146K9M8_9EUKA|eukprot:JAP92129.1 Protein SEY1 [Trepomonas sp. PC1]